MLLGPNIVTVDSSCSNMLVECELSKAVYLQVLDISTKYVSANTS